jgi:alkylation response protein AidB-like acyl-CoA dehydrogenase
LNAADEPGAAVWRQAAEELGLQGLIVPEQWGGSGASLIELGVVFEEMGRALFGAPFFGTAGLAVPALLAVDDAAACAQYLPGIAAGETIATLAWGGADPRGQNHGGIGFTWEHPAHLYLKRAKSTELFLGSPARHRRRLAALLSFDSACGGEVYGSCTELRGFLEDRGQAYVLRVASSLTLTLAPGTRTT